MRMRRGPCRPLLVLAVCLGVLTPAAAQQPPGEWQLVSMNRWDRVLAPPAPGEGRMGIRVFRFDEQGGEAEATIELAQAVCATPPGTRGDVEIVHFKWTFTAPITRLRPGDPIPVAVETWVPSPSRRCPNFGAVRTGVFVIGSVGTVLGNLIAAEQRSQYWGAFSYAFQPVPPGVRFSFDPARPDAASGRAVLRADPYRVPGPGEPQRGWFAIHFSTTATRGSGEEAAFFYTYLYGAGSTPVVDPAAQDMIRRAARDGRFSTAIAGSLGVLPGWGPDWELRWMDFGFSNGRQVRVYHATNKANRAIRYTIYLDPDRGAWANWEPA